MTIQLMSLGPLMMCGSVAWEMGTEMPSMLISLSVAQSDGRSRLVRLVLHEACPRHLRSFDERISSVYRECLPVPHGRDACEAGYRPAEVRIRTRADPRAGSPPEFWSALLPDSLQLQIGRSRWW